MSMKLSSLSPAAQAGLRLCHILGLTPKNSVAARLFTSAATTPELCAAIRAEFPGFDEVPAVIGHGEKALFIQRHGVALTSVGQAILAYVVEQGFAPAEIPYLGFCRRYFSAGENDTDDIRFHEWLKARGLKLKKSSNGWWTIEPA